MQVYGYVISHQLAGDSSTNHQSPLPNSYCLHESSSSVNHNSGLLGQTHTPCVCCCCHQRMGSLGNCGFPSRLRQAVVFWWMKTSFYFLPHLMFSTGCSSVFFTSFYFLPKPCGLKVDFLSSLPSSVMFIISFPHCSQAHLGHNFFSRCFLLHPYTCGFVLFEFESEGVFCLVLAQTDLIGSAGKVFFTQLWWTQSWHNPRQSWISGKVKVLLFCYWGVWANRLLRGICCWPLLLGR